MAFNDSVVLVSSDSECESDITSGSMTPERIVTETGRVILPVADELVNCYNYLLESMLNTFNVAIKFHNYNPERYTFQCFCKTVIRLAFDKEDELNQYTHHDRLIYNHLVTIMEHAMDLETASCDTYHSRTKLVLFCCKFVEVIDGAVLTNM